MFFKNEETEIQEAVVEIRKKRRRKIKFIILAIIIVAVIGGTWFGGYSLAKKNADAKIAKLNAKITEMEATPVVLDPITPEIVRKVLKNKVSEISELATAEYSFTNADKFSDTKGIVKAFDWMTKKSFVLKWEGKIKAGVDLKDVEFKTSVKNKVITITLPHSDILSYETDLDSVKVLDEKDGLFNPVTLNDTAKFNRESKYDMQKRAVDTGLLEKADRNLEIIITNLLYSNIENIRDYEIKFVRKG